MTVVGEEEQGKDLLLERMEGVEEVVDQNQDQDQEVKKEVDQEKEVGQGNEVDQGNEVIYLKRVQLYRVMVRGEEVEETRTNRLKGKNGKQTKGKNQEGKEVLIEEVEQRQVNLV